jgi:ATP-dependent DNA helicase RecG
VTTLCKLDGVDVTEVVARLREEGSDTEAVEAKAAQGGLPQDLDRILCAFANRPGGGCLILGLDESRGFQACPVYDVKAAQQAISDIARKKLDPPVRVGLETVRFEDEPLVVVDIAEADPSAKPVVLKGSGRGYIRQYDGTFEMSQLERQAFIAGRSQPVFDQQPVPGATRDDLDEDLVRGFIANRRQDSPVFQDWDDATLLSHACVATVDGTPTLAGLLALGVYPQQFFPSLAISASLWSGEVNESALLDSKTFVGPIPRMLADAEAWVARSTRTAIAEDAGGDVVNLPEYPGRAVRELVANALIHRDLGPYALGQLITLSIETHGVRDDGRLVIANPGGLYGVSLDRLGHAPSQLRNTFLASILRDVTSGPDGKRVIERLGTGIPAVRDAMRRAYQPAPRFYDSGLAFTAVLVSDRGAEAGQEEAPRRPAAHDRAGRQGPRGRAILASRNEALILSALSDAPRTVAQVHDLTSLTERQVRYGLRHLRAQGYVVAARASGRSEYFQIRPGGPNPDDDFRFTYQPAWGA